MSNRFKGISLAALTVALGTSSAYAQEAKKTEQVVTVKAERIADRAVESADQVIDFGRIYGTEDTLIKTFQLQLRGNSAATVKVARADKDGYIYLIGGSQSDDENQRVPYFVTLDTKEGNGLTDVNNISVDLTDDEEKTLAKIDASAALTALNLTLELGGKAEFARLLPGAYEGKFKLVVEAL